MKRLKAIISTNRYFFIGYGMFVLSGALFLFFTTKSQGFLLMNSHHDWVMDDFFRIYTNTGDGIFCIVVFLLLLLAKKKLLAWELVITMALSGLIVQIIKNIFPMPRPRTLLGDEHYHYFIDGLTQVGNASFPSGHTATAFGMATILAILGKDKRWNLLYLVAALMVGWSRIYLGQHFLQDVIVGSLIGVISALLVNGAIDDRSSRLARKNHAREI
jgi:membrane-associated phospholipid phosphatase